MTSTQRAPEYVLGTGSDELDRLGLQHRLWSDFAHAGWRRAGIAPGMRVLDIGCGPGFGSFDLAQIVGPQGHVVGVDESPGFIGWLNEQAAARGLSCLRGIVGDVHDLDRVAAVEAGAAPASFDAAYSRWVLCFVKDPARVIRAASRLIRPAGRLVIHDYFNYEAMCTAPRSAAFAKTVAATGAASRARGGDMDVMSRVPGMLLAEGFDVVHMEAQQRLARPGEPMWYWPQTFWTNFLPVLVKMGLLTEQDRAAWHREWDELAKTPGAFVTLPVVYEVIAVRR